VTAEYDFVLDLDALEVPLFTASPAADNREFTRPAGWAQLTADGNDRRLKAYRDGHAVCGVMGGQVAAVDVDIRNGGDVDKVRHLLVGLDVATFAEVATPGGGRHFYVAGHPDLPTVHATADRHGLMGYPGAEIISFGANVFLPGTRRPKYDGRGYKIVFSNLAALANGGDPDGAETFAAWVADHRATATSDGPTSPPWDGRPHDARQVAYLTGVLRNHHDRIATMPENSGRNVALFNAAMNCGIFIAGAGLDQTETIRTLTDAADACGLTAEDGLRSVQATIASGLKNGLNRPKAVPPTVGDPANEESPPTRPATSTAAPMSLADALAVFGRWLHLDDEAPVLAVAAVMVANLADGDPVWLLIVGPPSGGKTEILTACTPLPCVIPAATISEAALLSGTSRKERAKDATGGLLRQVGSFGILLAKDFTSVLSQNKDTAKQAMAALREVYDGRWDRPVGTDGGRVLTWEGKCGLVGGVTPSYDRYSAVISALGDRFMLLRLPDVKAGEQALSALDNSEHEKQMRTELSAAMTGLIANADRKLVHQPLTDSERDHLIRLATFAARARTGVERDGYSQELLVMPQAEGPARLVKAIRRLYGALGAIGADDETRWAVVVRVALDCAPAIRVPLMRELLKAGGPLRTSQLAAAVGMVTKTAHRQLDDLALLGIATRTKQSTGDNAPDYWQASDWLADFWPRPPLVGQRYTPQQTRNLKEAGDDSATPSSAGDTSLSHETGADDSATPSSAGDTSLSHETGADDTLFSTPTDISGTTPTAEPAEPAENQRCRYCRKPLPALLTLRGFDAHPTCLERATS